MKIFLVGGAVRDELLGHPVEERDYVVVGATAQEMIEKGFRLVGKDFPVFLHPTTHDEYALARTERKVGKGYTGFTCYAAPDVTLEDDLKRRDLTINAIAKDDQGNLIDPYNGQSDLQNKILRHVSPAFSEDPVRILRLARFAARFVPMGFQIAHETLLLMQQMVRAGEVNALVPERVWQEFFRALQEKSPQEFFMTLRECGALAILFPEIDQLFGVPNPVKWHPEIDTGVHTMMVLKQAAKLTDNPATRFAALVHDLGKAATPPENWPSHPGHEEHGINIVKDLCTRFRVPTDFRELALITTRYHGHCHRVKELNSTTLVKTLEALDAFRRPERFEQFLIACEADFRGRPGFENKDYPNAEYFRDAFKAANSIDLKPLLERNLNGLALGNAIHEARVGAVNKLRNT